MKPILAALTLALLPLAAPAPAQSIDMSSMTPVLTWPDPAPEPVTRTRADPDR